MKASLWGFRLVFVCVCVNVSYQNLETNLYSVTRNQCPSLEEKTQIHCIKQTTKFFTSKQPFHSTPGRRRLQVLDARASSCSDPVCSVGGWWEGMARQEVALRSRDNQSDAQRNCHCSQDRSRRISVNIHRQSYDRYGSRRSGEFRDVVCAAARIAGPAGKLMLFVATFRQKGTWRMARARIYSVSQDNMWERRKNKNKKDTIGWKEEKKTHKKRKKQPKVRKRYVMVCVKERSPVCQFVRMIVQTNHRPADKQTDKKM